MPREMSISDLAIARDERVEELTEVIRNVAGWVEHWQIDREHGLMPTAGSLADALVACRVAIAKDHA